MITNDIKVKDQASNKNDQKIEVKPAEAVAKKTTEIKAGPTQKNV